MSQTEPASRPSNRIVRLAAWCYDRRRRVLLIWIVAVVGFSIAGQAAGGSLLKTFDLPGSDAAKAFTVLGRAFDRPGDTGQVVWRATSGDPTDPAVQEVVEPLLKELAA